MTMIQGSETLRHKWVRYGPSVNMHRCQKCECIRDKRNNTVKYTKKDGDISHGTAPICIDQTKTQFHETT